MIDLDELERLAREADPAKPWVREVALPGFDEYLELPAEDRVGLDLLLSAAELRHIVAANPATILALVERVREAESRIACARQTADDHIGAAVASAERADRAEAELKALRERVASTARHWTVIADKERSTDVQLAIEDVVSDLEELLEPVKP